MCQLEISEMIKIILVKRYDDSDLLWSNLVKTLKVPNFTVKEVLKKYQGFEGDFLNLFDLNDDSKANSEVISQSSKIKNENNCLMYFVISDFEQVSALIEKEAVKVGYDVGVCEEDATPYSSIFNEILFGNLNELIEYRKKLNEHFLFESYDIAVSYVDLHNELSLKGKGVEDYQSMQIYEMWKYQ